MVVEDKILLNDSLPIPEKENSSHSQIDDTEDINEENNESPFFDMIYNHMNGVNQWIADFYNSNTRIQADMNTIRVMRKRNMTISLREFFFLGSLAKIESNDK